MITLKPKPNYAIIVAGGTGKRMGAEIPKQFLPLKGLPILMHTLNAFSKAAIFNELIVVLHPNYHQYWNDLCKKFDFTITHKLANGGDTRFQSVKNGLCAIEENEGFVAIHDAVRPLVSPELIVKCVEAATEFGNAVPAIPPHESVRKGSPSKNKAEDRNTFWLVQTPQVFGLNKLKNCYNTDWEEIFTDDASVAEKAGENIHIIEGERTNIKVTTPFDIAIAKNLLG